MPRSIDSKGLKIEFLRRPVLLSCCIGANHRAQKRRRLGDVPQGPGVRGTGLARPLVQRQERVGCGEPGVARREPRRLLPQGAKGHRASLEQGSQARNCGGHSHGERACGVSRET
jgi:hypothetical protein